MMLEVDGRQQVVHVGVVGLVLAGRSSTASACSQSPLCKRRRASATPWPSVEGRPGAAGAHPPAPTRPPRRPDAAPDADGPRHAPKDRAARAPTRPPRSRTPTDRRQRPETADRAATGCAPSAAAAAPQPALARGAGLGRRRLHGRRPARGEFGHAAHRRHRINHGGVRRAGPRRAALARAGDRRVSALPASRPAPP